MPEANVVEWIREKFRAIVPDLDERGRRRWAALEARSLGRGGIAAVSVATAISDRTIRNGIQELNTPFPVPFDRQRRPGGGRKSREQEQPGLVGALERLVEPDSRGDPQSPLRWTCKSTRQLAQALQEQGFQVSHRKVGQLLKTRGYSLQSNRKTREGAQHPDRNAQFQHIAKRVKARQRRGEPALSVDTKKKEVLGNLKNPGKTYRRKGQPVEVAVHDFPDPKLGKAIPYGVYDLNHNEAGVSVGITHDTAEFAVEAIRRWWKRLGKRRYRSPQRLLITADSGGSNSCRNRLWKVELQKFADETGMIIEVCHFPPGTSKWNKIEHRVFCHITRNWRGIPLQTLEVVVQLIGATRTREGLDVHAWLDDARYEKGRKITKAEMAALHIKPNKFQSQWNYEIHPRHKT
jgi:transposase